MIGEFRHVRRRYTFVGHGSRHASDNYFVRLDVEIATLGVLGMCNWVAQWYRPGGRLGPRAVADQFADLVIDGLKRTE